MTSDVSSCVDELMRSGPSLLIVEDERIARRALAVLLRGCGYRAVPAASAEIALEIIESRGVPHIALVDIDLPGMSGLEFVAELERLSPGVVIVLVSAADGERIRAFCREHEHVTYIRKPLDFPKLLLLLDQKSHPN